MCKRSYGESQEDHVRKHLFFYLLMLLMIATLLLACHRSGMQTFAGKFLGQRSPGSQLMPYIPRLFSSTGKYRFNLHSSLLFTLDGTELYFTDQNLENYQKTILFMSFREGIWSEPAAAPFSGQYSDEAGWFSPDGHRLYFFSNRPLRKGRRKMESEGLWVIQRHKDKWALPVPITRPDELTRNDGTLFVSAQLPGGYGSYDIYYLQYSGSHYGHPKNIGPMINSGDEEYVRCISREEDFIVFYRFSQQNRTRRGLYAACRNKGNTWQQPLCLDKVLNLPFPFDARLSPDGEHLFILNRKDGIYWIRTDRIRDVAYSNGDKLLPEGK
jgi:hypothetical protein